MRGTLMDLYLPAERPCALWNGSKRSSFDSKEPSGCSSPVMKRLQPAPGRFSEWPGW